MNKLISSVIIFLFPITSFSWVNWKTLETDKFQIIYKPGYELSAKECLKVLEYYRKDAVNLTGHNLGKIPIVIEDIGTMSNGLTDYIFRNIHLFTYPPESFSEIAHGENWWRMVGIHEYMHMAHLTYTGGIPKFLTAIIGTPFQPNIWSPFWLMEGIATFGESQLSPYEGRLNDGFFDAYISVCASEGKFPSILDATYLPFEYPYFNGRYIYGGKFLQFLAERYGKEKFARLFKDNGSSILAYFSSIFPCFGFDMSVSSLYFGKDFPSLFSEWKYYEFQKNKGWKMDGERLTKEGGTVKFLTSDKNKLYYVRESKVKTGAAKSFYFTDIVERDLNTQKERVVVSLTTYITCHLRVNGDKLYYSALDMSKGYANTTFLGFGFFSNLHEKDLKAGKDKILLKDKIRSFAILKDGKILYAKDKKQGFGSELYIYSSKTNRKEQILDTDYLVGEIDASDKYIVICARKDWGNWNIYLFDIYSKTLTPIIETPYKEASISLNDGKVFFIANYDKIYTCYAYDFETKNFYKLTKGGYANYPVYNKSDSTLYFIGINSKGNDLYRKRVNFTANFIPREHSKIEETELPELNKKVKRGGYLDALKTLLPAIRIPIILPVDTTLRSWALGGILMGKDAIGEHSYGISFLLPTTSKSKPFFAIDYSSLFFVPFVTSFEFNNYLPYISLNITYPFFIKPDARFSYLGVSLAGEGFDSSFSRKTFFPYLNSTFIFPKVNIQPTIAYVMERKFWGSNLDRNGFFIQTEVKKYIELFTHSELGVSIKGFYDPDNPNEIGPMTRDPFDPFYAKTGAGGSLDYSFPLIKIRNGLWNPNFYIEDICASLFCDFGYAHNKKTYEIFIGSEIKLEASFLSADYLRVIPIIGAGIDREKLLKIYFGIEIRSVAGSGFLPQQEILTFSTGKRICPLFPFWNLQPKRSAIISILLSP